jgi:hypothetical protein
MSERMTKLVTIGISMLVSIAVVTAIFLVIGVKNEALQATFIAILSASIALDVYPRLVNRFMVPQDAP